MFFFENDSGLRKLCALVSACANRVEFSSFNLGENLLKFPEEGKKKSKI